jgi:hypothetical protein
MERSESADFAEYTLSLTCKTSVTTRTAPYARLVGQEVRLLVVQAVAADAVIVPVKVRQN